MEEKKRKMIRITGLMIAVLMALLILPTLAKEEQLESSGLVTEEKVIAGGNVTDTVTWRITEDDMGIQTLVIDGTGPMTDYTNQSEQPWLPWKSSLKKLVVEDGVTRIGNYSMYGLGFEEVLIGKGVEKIGKHSFAYGTNLEHVRIPGNVKTIEANAFVFHFHLYSVTLEEGVEVLEHSSLGTQSKTGSVVHIPASVRQIDDLAIWCASGYTVADENPYYSARDGVLYNKEETALIDYPKLKSAVEYRTPDSVCEIKKGALHRIKQTKKIVISSSVQILPETYLFQWSDMEEVYVEDGVPISGYTTFYASGKLTNLRLPENISIDKIYNMVHYGCNSLESLKIPNGVKTIERIGDPLKALTEITYDASNAVIKDNLLLDANISYKLIVGENVDYLPAEFRWLSDQADTLMFQTENLLTIEKGAFANQESPIKDLEGNIYIDDQGVFYLCDEEENTAKVVYCQSGFNDIFIPAVICPDSQGEYQVVAVGKDAFKNADGVQTLRFENPEQIVTIEAYGFADCTTLCSINGVTEVDDVKALFGGVVDGIGYRAFYHTGLLEEKDDAELSGTVEDMECYEELVLEGTDGASDLVLSLESEGNTLEWRVGENGTGRYHLLTGDTITILAAAGNKEAEDNHRYRVYFQKTDQDCSLSVAAGDSYTFDDQKVDCYATEDPNCMYIEFAPNVGKTLSIPITAVYPSPNSDGGGLTIWAVSLDREQCLENEEKIVLSDTGAMGVLWATLRDEFTVSKTGTGVAGINLKGTEEGNVIPETDFNWKIVLNRKNETTSSYGKDYVRSVSYQDKLLLPKGMSWHDEVITAIETDSIRRIGNDWYAGERKICRIALSGGQLNLSGVFLTWDEELETVVIHYTVNNSVKNAQMNTNTITLIMYAEAFLADLAQFDMSGEQCVVNSIEAQVQYQHSGVLRLSSQAEKTITIGKGSIKLLKTTKKKPYYFGEEVHYDVTLYNPGALPYEAGEEGTWILQEQLSPYIYISVNDLTRMFEENEEKNLSVSITGADISEWVEMQSVFAGEVYWENSSNSGINLKESSDKQLVIRWNSTGSALQVETEDGIYEEESLEESLRQAGFAPGRWTEYVLNWQLNRPEDKFRLSAGETRRFSIYANAKDTFQMLSEDWPAAYPTDASLTLTSTATVTDITGTTKAKASVSDNVIREAYVRKQAFSGNRNLKDSFTVEDGECINYKTEFQHFGKGSYENLPMVDEMYGAQALLVPADQNPNLADRNLETYEKDGESFYILTEGTYENVRIGGSLDGQEYIAADISVQKVTEEQAIELGEEIHAYQGLYTRIQWNWASIPAGSYKLYLSYDVLVDQSLAGTNVFSLGNIVWMNNKINSRIYGSLWGGGSIIDFYKEILDQKGHTWQEDVIDEDGYSLLSAGEEVTYRMTLRCKGNGRYEVNGQDIADQLPDNHDVFKWEKDRNVTLVYESTHASTEITGLEDWSVEDSLHQETVKGQQFILWPDDTTVVFHENDAKVYIYVTLTYPNLTENDSSWTDYLKAVNGEILENTFYVYQFPVNVSHHLNEEGQILLQKGVYATGYGTEGLYKETESRNYYNNRDSQKRQVTYYMLLYNGGTKRWYLNDIYDYLPKGFTLTKLVDDIDLNKKNNPNSITTLTDFQDSSFVEENSRLAVPEDVRYLCANIQWNHTEDGHIRFRIGAGEGDQAVTYDGQRQQYYLNHNEAVLFGYMCEIGLGEETQEIAQNTAFMHYTDYPKTGVSVVDENQITFSGKRSEIHGDQNDGTCTLLSGDDIENQYQILDGDIKDQWILSNVTLTRGEIIPGITKYTESYTSPGSGITTAYTNAAGPYDEINWRVRLHNSGTLSITDYTFEDMLPNHYAVCGRLHYEIYDYRGNQMQAYEIAEFKERTDNQITFLNNNSIRTVSMNGESTEIYTSGNGKGRISIHKNEEGQEVLTIQFSDYTVSIPEGGYMDLYLSTNNPTNQYKNTVYTNQVFLTPNKQEFHMAGQGSMIRDENHVPQSVKSSAPVTIAFGYATGSEKAVEEKNMQSEAGNEKQAVSTNPENNYIILSSKESIFTYSLKVSNDTEKAMEKLVLIDNLPEPGDTSPFESGASRESQFKVKLAPNPNVKVLVTTESGEAYELKEEDYDVDYSEEVVFTEEDWEGTTVWNAGNDTARSLRIMISDESGELIPAKAQVMVSFDCMVDGTCEAGEIGWNSFGYHYKLLDVNQELEAMPLPVGVKIAEVPAIVKYLQDVEGKEQPAAEDTEFRFVVYEGGAVQNDTVGEVELIPLLEAAGRKYSVVSVLVKAGESKSEAVRMDAVSWVPGETYTICELENEDDYELYSINDRKEKTYSFTYESDKEVIVRFTNTTLKWSIEVIKTDLDDRNKVLPGAVFALYSPKEQEREPGDCSLPEDINVQETVEAEHQNWYLKSVQTSDDNGRIYWTDLKEDKYYLMEWKAPDGYNREETGWVVYRKDAKDGICSLEIENSAGSVFPETGGIGTGIFIAVGTAFCIAACTLCKRKKLKRRK